MRVKCCSHEKIEKKKGKLVNYSNIGIKFCSAQISEDNPSVGYKPEINLMNNKPVDEKIDQTLILKKPVSQ